MTPEYLLVSLVDAVRPSGELVRGLSKYFFVFSYSSVSIKVLFRSRMAAIRLYAVDVLGWMKVLAV